MTDKKSYNELKVTVWVGKGGCTESTIQEIRRQIKDRKVIKVRWLRNTEIDPEKIAASAGASLEQARGRTMVLTKGKKKAPSADAGNI